MCRLQVVGNGGDSDGCGGRLQSVGSQPGLSNTTMTIGLLEVVPELILDQKFNQWTNPNWRSWAQRLDFVVKLSERQIDEYLECSITGTVWCVTDQPMT